MHERARPLPVARRLGLAALATLAPLTTWAAGCSLSAMELPVRMVGTLPMATLTLNGQPAPMVVDTGAFFSILNESAAAQLHLLTRRLPEGMRINGVAGSMDARMAKVEKVGLSGGVIPNVEFVVGGSEVGGGAMGLIGRNFLASSDTEYDLAHGVIRLVVPVGDCAKTDMAYWAGSAPVNVVPLKGTGLREKTGAFMAEVQVNGRTLTALLDSGADESTLTLSGAERAGIRQADMVPGVTFAGVGSGHNRSWIARVDAFELGGERIEHSRLAVMDTDWVDQDMLLGVDYFLSHHLLVARSQGKLYATWNGGPVFGRNDALSADSSAATPTGVETPPTDADALLRRGAAFAARGDFVHALADLDQACALAATDAGCFATRAGVQLSLQHPAQALQDLDETLRLDPADTQSRANRAGIRLASGDRDGTLQDLRALDTALPPPSDLRASMGVLYAEMDMSPEALHQWTLWMAAHANDAGRAEVLNQRCWLRMKLSIELDRALDDCREAVDENPAQGAYRDSLGWVYVRRGDLGKAAGAFDEAIARPPMAAPAFYGRAMVRRRQGAAEAAQADLARARQLQPGIDDWARKLGLPTAD